MFTIHLTVSKKVLDQTLRKIGIKWAPHYVMHTGHGIQTEVVAVVHKNVRIF